MTESKIVGGDEHPSGLRDAIAGASAARAWPTSDEARNVEIQVRAWLSVVSEGEIEAAATEMALWGWVCEDEEDIAAVGRILAVSRGVLLPKETP